MTTSGPIGDWSLRKRLAVLFALVGAALAASVALAAFAVVHLHDTLLTQIDRIDPAQVAAEELLAGLISQESGDRGYIITRDRSFLVPYTQGQEEEGAAWNDLQRLLVGEPRLVSDLDSVLAAARQWQTRTALPTIIETEAGSSLASSPATLAAGRRQFAVLRARFDRLAAGLSARHGAADTAVNRADLILMVFLALALVLLLGAVELTLVALRRWVTSPIRELADQARSVSGGDTDHALAVAGPPEIRRLGSDVESMRRRIVSDVAAVESARRLLGAQAARLERSNVDLEQFASVASHDLQEPLRKMSGFSELLLRRYEDELDERGREYLLFVADGARRMRVMIDGILELARVGSGGAFEEVDCIEVAHEALSNLSAEVAETGAVVELGELPVVSGDRALLVALFQNLIGNSLRFRSARPLRVVVGVVEGPGEWRFVVRDNGIGIEPKHSEEIFEMFQRLQSRERYGGTGIGLAICRRIVEHHGGKIWLDTPAGPGAAIGFTLSRRLGWRSRAVS